MTTSNLLESIGASADSFVSLERSESGVAGNSERGAGGGVEEKGPSRTQMIRVPLSPTKGRHKGS